MPPDSQIPPKPQTREGESLDEILEIGLTGIQRRTAILQLARRVARSQARHIASIIAHSVREAETRATGELAIPAKGDDSDPSVSIIICTKDRVDLIAPCVESVFEITNYELQKIEILVVDNGSSDVDTRHWLMGGANAGRFRVIRDPEPFNFARLNNVAARVASNDVLVFINNDTEAKDPEWLRKLANLAARPEVGIVGARLLYPDGTIQHGGVIVGFHGGAAHTDVGQQADSGGYFGIS